MAFSYERFKIGNGGCDTTTIVNIIFTVGKVTITANITDRETFWATDFGAVEGNIVFGGFYWFWTKETIDIHLMSTSGLLCVSVPNNGAIRELNNIITKWKIDEIKLLK